MNRFQLMTKCNGLHVNLYSEYIFSTWLITCEKGDYAWLVIADIA